jgi:hypothetical protein
LTATHVHPEPPQNSQSQSTCQERSKQIEQNGSARRALTRRAWTSPGSQTAARAPGTCRSCPRAVRQEQEQGTCLDQNSRRIKQAGAVVGIRKLDTGTTRHTTSRRPRQTALGPRRDTTHQRFVVLARNDLRREEQTGRARLRRMKPLHRPPAARQRRHMRKSSLQQKS